MHITIGGSQKDPVSMIQDLNISFNIKWHHIGAYHFYSGSLQQGNDSIPKFRQVSCTEDFTDFLGTNLLRTKRIFSAQPDLGEPEAIQGCPSDCLLIEE